jgi:hypothetical protein
LQLRLLLLLLLLRCLSHTTQQLLWRRIRSLLPLVYSLHVLWLLLLLWCLLLLLLLLLLRLQHNPPIRFVLGLCQPAVMHKQSAAAVVRAGHLQACQPPGSTHTLLNQAHTGRLQQAHVSTLDSTAQHSTCLKGLTAQHVIVFVKHQSVVEQ